MAIETFACFDPPPSSALCVVALRPLKGPLRRKYRDMLK